MVHIIRTYTRRGLKKYIHTKKGKKKALKKREETDRKRKEKLEGKLMKKTKPKLSCMRSGRRPSPGWTRLLFAGTISLICPGDLPTEARRKTRPGKRQEGGRGHSQSYKQNKTKQDQKLINQHFYVQLVGQGRHKRPKGRQRRRPQKQNKTNSNIG